MWFSALAAPTYQTWRSAILGKEPSKQDHASLTLRSLIQLVRSTRREWRSVMSIFPTKIVLATDGSKDADLALSTAVDIATGTNSELHVITAAPGRPDPVYASHEMGFHWESYEEALEAVRKDAQDILDEQVRKVEEVGGTVAGAHLRAGERRDQAIVHLADELGAGLIVMGSRGLGGMRRAMMGSVSDSVVRHAHCPVLVVRSEQQRAG